MKDKCLYINGKWVGTQERRAIISPISGKELCSVNECTEKEIDSAIMAAKSAAAQDSEWRKMSVDERVEMLNIIADLIEENGETLARIESKNTGRLYRETLYDDIPCAVEEFRNSAINIASLNGTFNGKTDTISTYTINEPIGVCGIIVPWNYPLLSAATSMAPALAAGNSIIMKPSSITPASTIKLFELIQQIELPEGVVNLLLGPGKTVGNSLVESPDIDMIVFTGSTDSGKEIYRKSSASMKKLLLELGGKSPVIVFDDADLEKTIENVMYSIFLSQGQVCLASSRLLIQDTIHDEFLEKLVHHTKKIKLGDPMDVSSEMGPMITETHMNDVLDKIKAGIDEGAKCLCGGKRATEGLLSEGWYIEPTIFSGCTQDMSIVREEIFGPVLTVQSFSEVDDAVKLANDSRYGLAGHVYTNDISKGRQVAERIDSGIIWINTYLEGSGIATTTPYKESGIGRVGGIDGLKEYMRCKQINAKAGIDYRNWYGSFSGKPEK